MFSAQFIATPKVGIKTDNPDKCEGSSLYEKAAYNSIDVLTLCLCVVIFRLVSAVWKSSACLAIDPSDLPTDSVL